MHILTVDMAVVPALPRDAAYIPVGQGVLQSFLTDSSWIYRKVLWWTGLFWCNGSQASQEVARNINYGTVVCCHLMHLNISSHMWNQDCTEFGEVCQSLQINSYPTVIFYNGSHNSNVSGWNLSLQFWISCFIMFNLFYVVKKAWCPIVCLNTIPTLSIILFGFACCFWRFDQNFAAVFLPRQSVEYSRNFRPRGDSARQCCDQVDSGNLSIGSDGQEWHLGRRLLCAGLWEKDGTLDFNCGAAHIHLILSLNRFTAYVHVILVVRPLHAYGAAVR